MYYIGLDVHEGGDQLLREGRGGRIPWEGRLDQPTGAGRLDGDFHCPNHGVLVWRRRSSAGSTTSAAAAQSVAHPLGTRAIAAAMREKRQIDAETRIADCLRCDFLPENHMMPQEIRDRRRTLRYRHLLVRQMVQMKNRVSGLLMKRAWSTTSKLLRAELFPRTTLSHDTERFIRAATVASS